jgi:hypothetical protein
MRRGEVHTGFWWGKLRERGNLKDPSVAGKRLLRWISRTWEGDAWTGFICFGIGTDVRHL